MQLRKKSTKKLLKSRKTRKTSRRQSLRMKTKKSTSRRQSRRLRGKKQSKMSVTLRNFMLNIKRKSKDFINKFSKKKRMNKKEEDFNKKNTDANELFNKLNSMYTNNRVDKKKFITYANNNPYNAMKYFIQQAKNIDIRDTHKIIDETIKNL